MDVYGGQGGVDLHTRHCDGNEAPPDSSHGTTSVRSSTWMSSTPLCARRHRDRGGVRPEVLGGTLVAGSARPFGSDRAPPSEPVTHHRGREPTAGVRPRCRMRPWIGHAVARCARLARHGGRLLGHSTGPRPLDCRGGGRRRRPRASTGWRAISRRGLRGVRTTTWRSRCTSTWRTRWKRWCERLAGGVAPGGILFMVGHRTIDPATGAETAAAGQRQVSVDAATAALDPNRWTFLAAETARWPGPASTPLSVPRQHS